MIAGESQVNNQGDFAILRLLPEGTPDSTFGIHGWAVTDLGTDLEFPNCVALQTDGKIVTAGRKADAFQSDFTMVRYHPDGTVDSLFGNNGIVGTNLREEDEVTAIAIEPMDKSSSPDFLLSLPPEILQWPGIMKMVHLISFSGYPK